MQLRKFVANSYYLKQVLNFFAIIKTTKELDSRLYSLSMVEILTDLRKYLRVVRGMSNHYISPMST